MSQDLFEALDNAGLTRPTEPARRKVADLPPKQLFGLLEQIAEVTSVANDERDPGMLAHAATLSLSGGPRPCARMRCRTAAVDRLARVAALYSDRVYVFNPLPAYLSHPPRARDIERFLAAIQEDISILQQLRPLAASGHVRIVAPPMTHCPHCLAVRVFGEGADARFSRLRTDLKRRFLRDLPVELRYSRGKYTVHFGSAPGLSEHPRVLEYRRVPKKLAGFTRLVAKARAEGCAPLALNHRKALDLHSRVEDEVFHDLVFEMSLSQALDTSFLADSDLHVEALTALSGDEKLARTNRAVMTHLTAVLPFAGDVPISDLLTLRRREGEAFDRFRAALAKTVEAVTTESPALTHTQAKHIFHDVLRPGLAALDLRVEKAKQDLVAAPLHDAAGWTAALGFGMYVGLLPTGMTEAAVALGLAASVAKAVTRGLDRKDVVSSIREHELYFLWKVRQSAIKVSH